MGWLLEKATTERAVAHAAALAFIGLGVVVLASGTEFLALVSGTGVWHWCLALVSGTGV